MIKFLCTALDSLVYLLFEYNIGMMDRIDTQIDANVWIGGNNIRDWQIAATYYFD